MQAVTGANTTDSQLVSDYIAAVYGCVGQLAFKEDGRQWSRDSFKEAREHPIHTRPDLLAKAHSLLEPTLDHRRGRAVLGILRCAA